MLTHHTSANTLLQVAIALSLLVSEVAAPPFKQLVCTFSARPQLHMVKGDTLVAKVQDVAAMEWGMNTDIQVSREPGSAVTSCHLQHQKRVACISQRSCGTALITLRGCVLTAAHAPSCWQTSMT